MDTRTGELHKFNSLEERDKFLAEKPMKERRFFLPVNATLSQMERGRIAPHEKCPCGSGRRFGKCCIGRTTDQIRPEGQ